MSTKRDETRTGVRVARWMQALLALSLAACSGSGGDTDVEASPASPGQGIGGIEPSAPAQPPQANGKPAGVAEPMPAQGTPAQGSTDGKTVGGDGSQVVLSPLSAAELQDAALEGELACTFSIGSDAPLLLAKGDVASDAPSRGVVKVGDYVEAIAAPGGFDAMSRGTRFAGAGKTITISLTGVATGGGESPAKPATLTYDRADGARRTFDGVWQCGP